MFKKLLKIAITFALLVAAHAAYVRLFAIVAQRVVRDHASGVAALQPSDSRTKKEAIALAARAFGKDHWSADREVPGRYYNKERGYWMYYKEYERLSEGRQFRFKPFALIWQSRDKKDLKTVTSDEAIVDLDRPLGLAVNKPGAPPMRIVHAQVTGNVRLRDDKGTDDPSDDMRIGPMPYLEYDEPTLQIRSDSDVVIQDRDMWVTGRDLLIQLRPKEELEPGAGTTPGGFDGAKTAYLRNNVHIILYDGGRSGILPGKTRPEPAPATATDTATAGADGRTPVDLRCAGEMQIDLPKPAVPVRVGPPAPVAPTFARFSRDVVVLQGKSNQTPDQLNCDHLKLTLLPAEKPRGTADGGANASTSTSPPTAEDDSGGALGGLTLRRADATGHAVWLQSVSQGTKARCNELIYKKLAPAKPDETYLRADTTRDLTPKLWVEKLDMVQEGPNKGQIESITTIRAIDATIFDDGQSRDPETVVARGPGILETRPARDKPVERRAIWKDRLVMQNEIGSDAQLRKRITLTGDPKFIDVAQATLDSKTEIIVWLKPKPVIPVPAPAPASAPAPSAAGAAPVVAQAQAQPGSGKYEIETLRAIDDVHLTAPGRTMTARNVLVAVFETRPAPTPAGASAPAATGNAGAPATNSPAVATAPGGVPASSPATAPAPGLQGEAQVETKPAEPDVTVRANHVWARIRLTPADEPRGPANVRADATATAPPGPLALASTGDRRGTGKTKSEIQEVRLRGAVFFHQDPEPGKQRGTNVTGEAVDVTNQGESRMYFKVFHVDPFALDKNNKVLPGELLARIQSLGRLSPLARVETDDFTVEGPIIGLNQVSDDAWVDGRGTLTQMAPRGLLSDKGLDGSTPAPAPARTQMPTQNQVQAETKAVLSPLKISWTRAMQFRGRSTNPRGVPVARAQFFDNVHAENDESEMFCQEMTTYMDRLVALNRPRRDSGPGRGDAREPAAPEPKPQIALIDCLHEVRIDNRKFDHESDPDNPTLLERQVIEGDHVIYDKLSGNFLALPAEGELGKVYLYGRDGQNGAANPVPGSGLGPGSGPGPGAAPTTTANRRTIIPTANPSSRPAANTRRATDVEVVGSNTNGGMSPGGAAAPKSSAKAKAKAKAGTNTQPTPPPEPALPLLKLTQIYFTDEMHGRLGSGKDSDKTETRWADFFGDVEILHANAPSATATFDFDNPPLDGTRLTAQTVRVVSEPPAPGTNGPARNFLKAWEDADARTFDTTIKADKITYDSLKELFYAYGEDGRPVFVVQQKTPGSPATNASGAAAWYNRKTGESQVVDPQTIQFVDNKYGIRPGPSVATPTVKKPKKPLTPIKPPNRSYFERKGFSGH